MPKLDPKKLKKPEKKVPAKKPGGKKVTPAMAKKPKKKPKFGPGPTRAERATSSEKAAKGRVR